MADSEPPPITIFGKELHDSHLTEIGRVTTTWALFESKVDTMIWDLAGVDSRLGACMTTQIGSIHGRFRALLSLLHEAQVPELLIKIAKKLS
jgi:hypothetical protein